MARVPAGIGWRIPMVPFGRVAFPMVGIRGLLGVVTIRGLMPVIGVKVESPGVAMEIGVNMERFVPGIMDMFGRVPIPSKRT